MLLICWRVTSISSLQWKIASNFKTGSTLKCRNALTIDFTVLLLNFVCSLVYINRQVHFRTIKHLIVFNFSFWKVICKILVDVFWWKLTISLHYCWVIFCKRIRLNSLMKTTWNKINYSKFLKNYLIVQL